MLPTTLEWLRLSFMRMEHSYPLPPRLRLLQNGVRRKYLRARIISIARHMMELGIALTRRSCSFINRRTAGGHENGRGFLTSPHFPYPTFLFLYVGSGIANNREPLRTTRNSEGSWIAERKSRVDRVIHNATLSCRSLDEVLVVVCSIQCILESFLVSAIWTSGQDTSVSSQFGIR